MIKPNQRLASRLKRITLNGLVGLLAAAVALGVAELLAALVGVRSPVVAVGDQVIAFVPPAVKEIAISLFGTADKIALLVGIFSVLALFAIALGNLARKSFVAASVGIVALCAAGLVAGLASTDSTLASLLPTPIGAVVGIVSLRLLVRSSLPVSGSSSEPTDADADSHGGMDRRRFLITSAGVAALAAFTASSGRWVAERMSAAGSRAQVLLPEPLRRLAPVPSSASVGVDGVAPFVTPNDNFYRIDTALVVPQVSTDSWNLRVHGMVDQELQISWDELLDRKDFVEVDVTLTCVSNLVGGQLLGNARWLGIPVRNLLDEAGVDPARATQIVGRSTDRYTCGFPTEAVYDGRTCLLAIGMNGEPLPLQHGFPARLVTAGLYGYVSATKWLTEIEMTTMEDFDSFWVPRGYGKEAPIKTQSRIDVPKTLARVSPGSVQVAGFAWSQPRGVSRVEVSVDNGAWSDAELATEVSGSTWRQWVWNWQATPGSHVLSVRATDRDGQLQTDRRSDPLPDGATGLHTVSVTVAA